MFLFLRIPFVGVSSFGPLDPSFGDCLATPILPLETLQTDHRGVSAMVTLVERYFIYVGF